MTATGVVPSSDQMLDSGPVQRRRMRAAITRGCSPTEITDVMLEGPRAGEVLVRIAAAGVCHSDVHMADGHLGRERWPIVLGHEGAGVVESVGAGVQHVRQGDRVAFCFVPPCRTCPACVAGRFHLCELAAAHAGAGTLFDGTSRLSELSGTPLKHFNFVSCFAEYAVVPAAAAVPVVDELPLWQAALLGCAVLTGVGAVRNTADVRVGETVVVIGCGGVGLQVVAGARLAGAGQIIAVDLQQQNLDRARLHGATHVVDAGADDLAAEILALCPGGVDHAFEVVGRSETIRLAWDVLRPGATAVVVGLAPRGVEVSLPAIEFLSEKGIKGSCYGSVNAAVELPRLTQMAADGRLALRDAVSHITDLDGIEAAFERLRRGEGARTVVIIDADAAGDPELPR
ncbi:alcohol dehydrogenase catalytic domain-containing protein [Nocardioides mesophilus]|uniref:Alcohol dehydrogenase catalytic domain-containing protein n=1 Tax=Nocardioides mesophilus TaxID=433659 RepID=A0A7G9R9T8_9ACTN|nr:alcohol dehydrogenase catalytic domain-containing protein [Nocardioides mesophilus]QNN52363.1 alcohol dehydrogenase catalytic domain-containing protein [Nocardioides mesophilus]